MDLLERIDQGFKKLRLRDRVIATAATVAIILLGANLTLLKPQRLRIADVAGKYQVSQDALEDTRRQLSDLERDIANGVDRYAKERAELEKMYADMREVEAFFAAHDVDTAQAHGLIRGMIKDIPDLKLASLKSLPTSTFYTPPPPPAEKAPEPAKPNVLPDVKNVAQFLKKDDSKPKAVALTTKVVYRHGVELVLNGSYPALMSYLERMQNYPKRLFWSEAQLTTPDYPEVTLRVIIHTLSDRATPPLN